MANKKISISELAFTNLFIIGLTYGLERLGCYDTSPERPLFTED